VVGAQSDGPGTFWFDDVSIASSAPPPPPPPPLPPPALQVTAVQATGMTASSATIGWQTNNSANSRVDYGTTATYGSFASDATSVTNHSLTLSGLASTTTYHYQVTSVDGSAQTAKSVDLTFTTSAPSSNLLTNAGFESGTASWTVAPQGSIDAIAINAHGGTRSLRHVATAAWQASTQTIPATAGQSYTVSGWARSATNGGYLTFIAEDAAGGWLSFTNLIFTGSGAWATQSQTFVLPAGTTTLVVGAQSDGPGTFWFDDVSIVKNP
jgi:hypothetical protein